MTGELVIEPQSLSGTVHGSAESIDIDRTSLGIESSTRAKAAKAATSPPVSPADSRLNFVPDGQ
jgi:hypothetical protein